MKFIHFNIRPLAIKKDQMSKYLSHSNLLLKSLLGVPLCNDKGPLVLLVCFYLGSIQSLPLGKTQKKETHLVQYMGFDHITSPLMQALFKTYLHGLLKQLMQIDKKTAISTITYLSLNLLNVLNSKLTHYKDLSQNKAVGRCLALTATGLHQKRLSYTAH